MDTYAEILADAKKTQMEAARSLAKINASGDDSSEAVITMLKENIIACQQIIDRLGGHNA